MSLLTDPMFYLVSIPAVLLYGIAKGGFGGAISILAVPLMALVMAPGQAAAIMLPILVVMDFIVVYSFRRHVDTRALRLMLPAAMLGVGAGYLLAHRMNDDLMRVLIGSLALAFGVQAFFGWLSRVGQEHNRAAASLFGGLAGFTSFSIHAGGPPVTMYLLPKKLPPIMYAGTAGVFFWCVNLAKLPPYYALGQLTFDNLIYSAVLVPVAPLGVQLGKFLVRVSEPRFYYRVIALVLIVVGGKLLFDGLSGLGSSPATVAAAGACLYSGA